LPADVDHGGVELLLTLWAFALAAAMLAAIVTALLLPREDV
jgi:hypothetical protein